MRTSLGTLFESREAANAGIKLYIGERWPAVSGELGLPNDTPPPNIRDITYSDGRVNFVVRLPEHDSADDRTSHLKFTLPIAAIDGDLDTVRGNLRRLFPLRCQKCGIHQPLGSNRCIGRCWSSLVWRLEAPIPRYYVENGRGYGLYGLDDIGKRTLQFVIDLTNPAIVALRLTLKGKKKLATVTEPTKSQIVYEITTKVVPGIDRMLGGSGAWGFAPHLHYDVPVWAHECPVYIRLPWVPPRVRIHRSA